MKSKLITLALIATLLASVVAPPFAGRAGAAAPAAPAASGMQSHAAFLDKTRFLAHVGAAYYAFHHWVYTPYKNGAFKSGAPGRIKAIAKAALALAFTYHELKVAYDIANKSSSKTLHALVTPLNALISKANAEVTKLKDGNASTSDLQGFANTATSFSSQAQKNGFKISDIAVPIPGLS